MRIKRRENWLTGLITVALVIMGYVALMAEKMDGSTFILYLAGAGAAAVKIHNSFRNTRVRNEDREAGN